VILVAVLTRRLRRNTRCGAEDDVQRLFYVQIHDEGDVFWWGDSDLCVGVAEWGMVC
jgi:hypothetical protein